MTTANLEFVCDHTRERYVNPERADVPLIDLYTVRRLSFEGVRIALSSQHTTDAIAAERRSVSQASPGRYAPYPRSKFDEVALYATMPLSLANRLADFARANYSEAAYQENPSYGDFSCFSFVAHVLKYRLSDYEPPEGEWEYATPNDEALDPDAIAAFTVGRTAAQPPLHAYLRVPRVRGENVDQPMALSVIGDGGLLTLCDVDRLNRAYAGPDPLVRRITGSIT